MKKEILSPQKTEDDFEVPYERGCEAQKAL